MTEKEELEKLRAENARWKSLFDTVIDGIVTVDAHGKFTYANPGAEKVLGLPRQEILRRTYHDPAWKFLTLEGAPIGESELPFSRTSQKKEKLSGVEMVIQRGDGSRVVVLINTAPLAEDGVIAGSVCIFTDITATYEMQKQRDDYLHMISHDLRIPLTVFQGHSHLLKEYLAGRMSIPWQESMEALEDSCRRMTLMIEELVDAARLEGGQLVLEKEPVAIAEFIDEMLRKGERALHAGRIDTDIEPELPAVAVDPGHLYRILANLITNALKFSPPESRIVLMARRGEGQVVISVRDHGSGIAPEDLSRVFNRFFQVEKVRPRTGVGLGLYITRLLVRAQGGRIWVESVQGEGSTFSFTLPVA